MTIARKNALAGRITVPVRRQERLQLKVWKGGGGGGRGVTFTSEGDEEEKSLKWT